jgi:hypothetical protein
MMKNTICWICGDHDFSTARRIDEDGSMTRPICAPCFIDYKRAARDEQPKTPDQNFFRLSPAALRASL